MSLAKIVEHGFFARRESYPTQGKIVAVDKTTFTCTVDVGFTLPDGTVQYIEDIPYQPQSPPGVGWSATLGYSNSNPNSIHIVMTQLTGIAAKSSVVSGGGNTPTATHRGQIMYSEDGATFVAATPIVSDDYGIILTEDETGYLIVAD